jgi:hypothetical protein
VYERCTFTQHVVENLVIRYVIISCSQNPKKRKETGTKVKQGMLCMFFLQKPWPPPKPPPSYNLHFATFIEKIKSETLPTLPEKPHPAHDNNNNNNNCTCDEKF